MIEDILVSNRQGRNIEGFDQVYADPAVKNALQLGNDTVARTYIRDKLCTLGLMNVSGHAGKRETAQPTEQRFPTFYSARTSRDVDPIIPLIVAYILRT